MIKFGTDGWRGIIADDFTFENVRLVSQAISEYVLAEAEERRSAEAQKHAPTLIVGFDTRFLSDRFAREVACVASANGLKVLATDSFAPTPAVSYTVINRQAAGAVMITASHNPYRYNGMKFKSSYGGSASPYVTEEIERILNGNIKAGRTPAYLPYEQAIAQGKVEVFDPKEPYFRKLGEIVDTERLKAGKMAVVVDNMYGAGRGYLGEFLRRAGCRVEEMNDRDNPYFAFTQPEPIRNSLAELIDKVTGAWPLGLALDGDADRIGAVDFLGNFINSHQIFALILRYLREEKGYTGSVVKTVTTTGMIDKMAAEYGLELHETPVGFKHVCELMLEGGVLMGGEESGGLGIAGHIPERDGILMGALLLEMISFYGELPTDIWKKLQKKHGYFCYDRIDIEVGAGVSVAVAAYFRENPPSDIASESVSRIDDRDGFKYYLSDGSWLMIRPSGTENVIRVYAEANSPERVATLLKTGQGLVDRAR